MTLPKAGASVAVEAAPADLSEAIKLKHSVRSIIAHSISS